MRDYVVIVHGLMGQKQVYAATREGAYSMARHFRKEGRVVYLYPTTFAVRFGLCTEQEIK